MNDGLNDELYAVEVDTVSDVVMIALGQNGISVNDDIIDEIQSYISHGIEKAFLLGTGDIEI